MCNINEVAGRRWRPIAVGGRKRLEPGPRYLTDVVNGTRLRVRQQVAQRTAGHNGHDYSAVPQKCRRFRVPYYLIRGVDAFRAAMVAVDSRSEERRVGKECRSRW